MAKKIFFPKEDDKNNRFTTIKFLYRDNRGAEVWLFKCDCGNYREKNPWYVYSGKTKSCGCLALEIRKNHKAKNTRNEQNKNISYLERYETEM